MSVIAELRTAGRVTAFVASLLLLLALALALMLGGCEQRAPAPPAPISRPAATTVSPAPPATSFYGSPFEKRPDASEVTALGRVLFSDPLLSASGRMSCASCHDPAHAYGPPNHLAVQLGGPDSKQPGIRAVPSLKYQQDAPPFSEHFSDTDGNDSEDQGPTGGRDWDGRASSAHEQAVLPLLSPFEMANPDSASVVARLRASPNAARFRQAFGEHVFDDPALAWNGLLLALEVFQQSPTDFYPYTSKYDAYLRRSAVLDASEQRGLALFNDAAKANCAQCHPAAVKRGAFPQFTDHGFIALGVPRNPQIPANADPAYHDLGLCGPVRVDLKDHPEYCGLFKTPTLRNVALRGSFFHNGVFNRLEDAVRFYAQRDAHPDKFYPRGSDGKAVKFDDLPPAYHANLTADPPFDRKPGLPAALSDHDIADLVAFLNTLTDGYVGPASTGPASVRTLSTAPRR